MTDMIRIIQGTAFFIVGYFIVLILQHVVPAILNLAIFENTLGTAVVGIFWVALILIWVLLLLIIPIGLKVWGLIYSEDKDDNPILSITFALLYSFFTFGVVYFGWFWVDPLMNALTYPLLTALFWMGLISVFVFDSLIIPSYCIIRAKRG